MKIRAFFLRAENRLERRDRERRKWEMTLIVRGSPHSSPKLSFCFPICLICILQHGYYMMSEGDVFQLSFSCGRYEKCSEQEKKRSHLYPPSVMDRSVTPGRQGTLVVSDLLCHCVHTLMHKASVMYYIQSQIHRQQATSDRRALIIPRDWTVGIQFHRSNAIKLWVSDGQRDRG